MKTKTLIYCLVLLLVMHACHKEDSPLPLESGNTVQLSSTAAFGNILTDSAGKTLYFFSSDANGTSGCTGGCLINWPIFYTANLRLPNELTATDFGTITRSDGQLQTTYKGWPLYYYVQDDDAGDVYGDRVGDVWYVAKPDYSLMLAKTQLVGKDSVQYDSTATPGTSTTLYITDDWGRTLYAFAPDSFNLNKFTKPDFSNDAVWPIFGSDKLGQVPSALPANDFQIIDVYGRKQFTYRGWPMYYFGADSMMRGKTLGVSVPAPGVWPVFLRSSPQAPKP